MRLLGVAGSRGTHDADRILATVMFTDIVSSTEHAARLGDRRWHDLISDHDQLVSNSISAPACIPGSASSRATTSRA